MSELTATSVGESDATAGSRVGGFKKRLATNTLTPQDKDALNLARAIREARLQGVSMSALAKQLGMAYGKLVAFAGRGVCKVAFEHLAEIESSSDEKVRAQREREQTEEFEALRPKALKFYRDALGEKEITDPDTGEKMVVWSNPAMAMWATEQITKGAGWNQPKVTKASVVQLNVSFINGQSAMMDEDEAPATETPLDATKDKELSAEEYHQLDESDDDE